MSVVSLFMIRLISGVRCYQPDPAILHSLLALHLIVLAATDHHCQFHYFIRSCKIVTLKFYKFFYYLSGKFL